MKKFTISDNLNDWNIYRGMSRWFSPRLLVKVVRNVIISTVFGRYADKRIMHASLDVLDIAALRKNCGVEESPCEQRNGALWLDYVADLGDGFDSTYAIAYLIGQKSLEVDDQTLPRANCLIMGGDQVYPDASGEDYKYRMQTPYEAAFPRTDKPNSEHPPVFVIPGNHDWYDGLTLFLAKFCRGRDTNLGSWIARQSRSYFAIHLGDNWWIWGFDSQLGEDIDKPQADYFVAVAREMKPKETARIILCASAPTWLHADYKRNSKEERATFARGLDYVSNIIADECPGAKVPLILSGDLHHYSRFESQPSKSIFLGAGGGGAFLHPTHGLPGDVTLTWAGRLERLIMTKKAEPKEQNDATCSKNPKPETNLVDTCYPDRKTSRRLSLWNVFFLFRNLEFCITLGIVYFAAALSLLAWGGYGSTGGDGTFDQRVVSQLRAITLTPIAVMIVMAFIIVLNKYADVRRPLNWWFGSVHAVAHLLIVFVATAISSVAFVELKSGMFGELAYFVAIGISMVAAGVVGGIVWGLYLLSASFLFAGHPNDAFSAMRLDSYRHFLRMKIEGDILTIFPIGIDHAPRRRDWQKNKAYAEGSQDEPFFIPSKPLAQHLIEEPIMIDSKNILPLQRTKS